MNKFGLMGYGFVMCVFEKMLESPMVEMEFRFEEYELLDMGLNAGDRKFCEDILLYGTKNKVFSMESFGNVYFIIRSPMLMELLADRISQDKQRSIRKHETEKIVRKVMNSGRKKKLILAEDSAKVQVGIRRIQAALMFSEEQIEEAQAAFVGFDVRESMRWFREVYVVEPLNLELYINTITEKTAFNMFIKFMYNDVLAKQDRDRIAESAKRQTKVQALLDFNPEL